jgi:outer membrane protein TolC
MYFKIKIRVSVHVCCLVVAIYGIATGVIYAADKQLQQPAIPNITSRVGLLDAVRFSLAMNPNIQIQERQVESSSGISQQATGQFDSTVGVEVGHNLDSSPLNKLNRYIYAAQGFPVSQLATEATNYSLSLNDPLRNGIVLSSKVGITSTTNTNNDITSKSYGMGNMSAQNLGSVGFSISIPLLKGNWESASAGETAAKLEVEAARQDLRYTISQNIQNTVQAYWALLAAHKNLEITKESEEGISLMVDQTRKLIKADELPASDINLLLANQLNKTSLRISNEQALLSAQQALGQLMGLTYQQISTLNPTDEFPPTTSEIPVHENQLARLTHLAMERRSDLAAALLRQDSARTLTSADKNNLKPQLNLTGSIGYAGLVEGGNPIEGLSQNISGANFGTTISYLWPFDNNVARGRYRQQAALYDQSTIQIANVTRSIGLGVEIAMSGLMRSAVQLKKSEEAVKFYNISVENEKIKYKLGNSTMVDILTTNDRLLNERLNYISYRLNYLSTLVQLNFQAGALLAESEMGQSIRLDQLISIPKFD